MGPKRSLCKLMGLYGSVEIHKRFYASLGVLIGPYASLSVFMGPCGLL